MRITSAIVGVLIVIFVASSLFVVREGQTALLLQFGRIVKTDFEPGVHFKLPLLQQAMLFDKRILTLDSAPERYLTAERKDVNVDFFVKWRISDAAKFYSAVAGDEQRAQQQLVGPIVKEGLRTAIGSRLLQDLVSGGRGELTQPLVAAANKATQNLGIDVIDLRIKRIDLPEEGSVLQSVYERMRSERKKVANQLRAEGNELGQGIRADADRQVQVLKAEAGRDAEKTRGEGDAKAAEIYAGSYGRDPEFYGFIRSLEAYRQALPTQGSMLVLDPKSEFLRYMQESK